MTTVNRESFEAAILENPVDIETRLVFADWLDENGQHDKANHQRVITTISPKSLGTIFGNLEKANGKRRTRTLDESDVINTVIRATEKGWAWVNGGTVANAYGYPAVTTWILAVKKADGTIAVDAGEGSASKNRSPVCVWKELVLWKPGQSASDARIAAWAEAR
jgi:uncharacterized protein (TIGR02996 family)